MTIANNLGKTIQGRPKSTSERNTPKTMMSGSLGSWSSRLVCSCPLPAFLVICLLLFKLCSFRRHGHFQFRFSFLPYFTLNTVSWIAVITPMGSMDRPFVFRVKFLSLYLPSVQEMKRMLRLLFLNQPCGMWIYFAFRRSIFMRMCRKYASLLF